MENNNAPRAPPPFDEKKLVGKTRSFDTAASIKLRSGPSKRKSFNLNDAVKSLDQELCRLKKSKLVNGEYATGRQMMPVPQGAAEMFMDICASSNVSPGTDTSMMSIDFSHYELMRDLSRANCNSDAAFSGNTCSTRLTPAELNVKDEHLERYFRSMEVFAKNRRGGAQSNMDLDLPTKK